MVGEEDGLEYVIVEGDPRNPEMGQQDEYPGYPLHSALSSDIADGDKIAALVMSNENMLLEPAANGYLPVHVAIENERYEYLHLVLTGRCITVQFYQEQSMLNPLIFAIWRGASFKCLEIILTLFPESRSLVDSKDHQAPIHHLILNLASDEYLTKLLKRSLEVHRLNKIQGSTWNCPSCTLINRMDSPQCEVCGSENPHLGNSANSVEIERRYKRHDTSIPTGMPNSMEYFEGTSSKSSHRGSTYSARGSMYSMEAPIACTACTYLNVGSNQSCEMCGLDLPVYNVVDDYDRDSVSGFAAAGAGDDLTVGGDVMIGSSSPGGESLPLDEGIPLSRQNSLEAYKTYFTHGDTHLASIVTRETIDLLCEGVENPCCEVDKFNRTPLHYAALLDTTGALIQLLLQYAPQTTLYKDENERTPLHFASIFANVHAIGPLMACDKDALKVQDKFKAYPIDYAVYAAPIEGEGQGEAVFGTLRDLILHDEFLSLTIGRLNSALQIMAKLPTDILLRGGGEQGNDSKDTDSIDEYIHPGAIVVPSPIHGSDQLSIYAGDIAKVNSVLPNGDVLINMLNGTNMNTLFTLKPIEIRVIKGEYFVNFMHRVVRELTDLIQRYQNKDTNSNENREKLSTSTIVGILVNNDVISTVENLINDKEHAEFAALKESATAFLSFVNDNNIFKSIHNANWSKVMTLSADGGASMVNSSGQYPLHVIAMLDDAHIPPVETIKGLITAAPEAVNKKDCNKNTPMYYAVTKGSVQVMQCLIEDGADLLQQHLYVAQYNHDTVQMGDKVLVRPSVYEKVSLALTHGEQKIGTLDESWAHEICELWSETLSDHALTFTEGRKCAKRKGNVSCYPASLVAATGSISLTCRLEECADHGNTMSFGIGHDIFKKASSDGFGAEQMSFGLSDNRQASSNRESSGARIIASGQTVKTVRHLAQGDVLCLRYEEVMAKCWLYVYREANYPHGGPDIYHEFDVPAMNYVVGATFANDHMLRILPHQPPKREVGTFNANIYSGIVSGIETHEYQHQSYSIAFQPLVDNRGEGGCIVVDGLRRQDFDLFVGSEEGEDNIDYTITKGQEHNREHIKNDDPNQGWDMVQDDTDCELQVKVNRGVVLRRIRFQLLNEVSMLDLRVTGKLHDYDNEHLFSKNAQAQPVTDGNPQWIEVELPDLLQSLSSGVTIDVTFKAIADTAARLLGFRLEGNRIAVRELQTWKSAQLLNTQTMPNGDIYCSVQYQHSDDTKDVVFVPHEEICHETHIYRALEEANIRCGVEFRPQNDGKDIIGTVPSGKLVQVVGQGRLITGDRERKVERLKRAGDEGWITHRYLDGSAEVMEFVEVMPSPKSYLEMLLQRDGEGGGILRKDGAEGGIDILEYLFKQYKGRCGSQNALHVALKAHASSMVISKLLSLDRNLSSQTNLEGMTPMQVGILSGMDASIFQMIIDADEACLVVIDKNEKNILHYAVEAPSPNIDIVKAILDHTDDKYVNYILGTPDKHNYMPFHYALQNQQCSLEIIHLLYNTCANQGVEIWAGDLYDTSTIERQELFPVRAKSKNKDKDSCNKEGGLSLQHIGPYKTGRNTMLHYTVSRALDEELYVLLGKYDRYANVKDRLGRSPLCRAVVAQQPLVVLEKLLAAQLRGVQESMRIMVLPTYCWRQTKDDDSAGVDSRVSISVDKMVISSNDSTRENNSDAIVRVNVMAEYGIDTASSDFKATGNYFEITIVELSEDGCVGYGFCPANYDLSDLMVGWKNGSWGLHSDDGGVYVGGLEQGKCERVLGFPLFAAGDTMGMGYIGSSQTLFFTKNGEIITGDSVVKCDNAKYGNALLHPSVCFFVNKGNTTITANFGLDTFAFEGDADHPVIRAACIVQERARREGVEVVEDHNDTAKDAGSTENDRSSPRPTRLDPIVIESPHDYEDNVTEYKTISIPGASGYSIHFDAKSHTEENCDYITFYTDDSHTTFFGQEKYSGKKFPGMNGESILHIPASAFIFHFRSDYSCHYWGYKITVIPTFDFGSEVTSALDTSNRSPLFYACYYKASDETVMKLLEALPDALFVPDVRGNLCLHALVAPAVGKRESDGAICSLNLLRELIKRYPESVSVSNLRNQTALHYYCQNRGKLDPVVIDLLMMEDSSEGSPARMKDSSGYIPLKYLLESMNANDYRTDTAQCPASESIMKLLRADTDGSIVLFCEMLHLESNTQPSLKQEIVVETLKMYIDSLKSEDDCSDIAASLGEKNVLTLLSEYAGNKDAEWILNKCRDSNIFLAIETQRWDTVMKLSCTCAKNINSRTGQHPAHCVARLGDAVHLEVITKLLEDFPQAAIVRDKLSNKVPIVYALESRASPQTIDALLHTNADFSMKIGDECFVAKHPSRRTEYLRWLPGKLVERDTESGSLSIQLEEMQREIVTISRDKVHSDVRCDTKVWQVVGGKILCLLKLGDDFDEEDHYDIDESTLVKTVGDEQMTIVKGVTFHILQRAETLGWMAWTDGKLGDDDYGYPILQESFFNHHPLHLALNINSGPEIVRTILKRCDNCASIREEGMLPLHKALQFKERAKDVVRMLVEAYPEACVEKCDGSTALHLAARNKDENAVNLLIEYGAQLKEKDKDNLEPFERSDDREASEMEAFLCEAEFSEKALQANDYELWFKIIQQSLNRLSEAQVNHYVQRTPALITATDTKGRTAQNLATPDVRNAMNATLLWFKKYQLLESRPEHISKTCHLYKAEDQTKADRPKVALKLMSTYSQFEREKKVRRKGTLNPEFVVDIIEDYRPSRASHEKIGDSNNRDGIMSPLPPLNRDEEDSDGGEDVKEFSSWGSSDMQLNKVQAESCFCLVMPLANRNMYVSLKQDRFAGTNMVEIGVVFQQIVQCVRHLHDKSIIHADLKPLNLVRTEYRWKLIDLDAACTIGVDHIGKKSSTAYVPPEAFYHIQSENRSKWILRSKSNIDSLDELSPEEKEKEYLLAHPSFDVWSLGCILYELCSKEVLPLFQSDRDDNISEDVDYQDNIYVLAEWEDTVKYRKLHHIKDDMARMLISQMLSRDPTKRPTLDRILQHPFISHKKPARVLGQQAEWDCFISYRKHCDESHAEKLYEVLSMKGGFKTWWDVKRLKAGCDWKEEFCRALLNTRTVVILISEESLFCKDKKRANFTRLAEDSTDNVLLEMTLAVELRDLGMVDNIVPVFIGNKKENGEYSSYFNDVGGDSVMKSIPDIVLNHIEADVRGLFDRNALGVPSVIKSARAVYKSITDKQGIEVKGDYKHAIKHCLHEIGDAVNDSKGKDSVSMDDTESGRDSGHKNDHQKKSHEELVNEIERLRRKLSLEADKREEENAKHEKEIAKLKRIETDMVQSKRSWYAENEQKEEVQYSHSGKRIWNSSKSHQDKAHRRASAPPLHHES